MRRRDFLFMLAGLPATWSAKCQAVEFAKVVPGRRLAFPADYGAHPNFRTEWWYATGWLTLPDGSPLGFQATFFRVRTGIGEANPSAFAPRQLILAHAAVADPRFGRLRHDERAARVGFGRAGFTIGETGVWIGDWRFEQRGGGYRAEVRGREFSYVLNFVPDGQPLANGEAGFSAKARDPVHASYYYSRPQLTVDGSVTVNGKSQGVTGRAWLDHEWSSELLPEEVQGWDWIGVNFDDGSALMAFRLRNKGSQALWAAASIRQANGDSEIVPAEAVAFEPVRQWRSPRTGITYPVEWRISIGQHCYLLHALMDDQELDSRRSTGAIYWEGAISLSEGGREVGRGYLEMTGYGERIRLG